MRLTSGNVAESKVDVAGLTQAKVAIVDISGNAFGLWGLRQRPGTADIV